jgi:NADH:ubiquinone oxidoreductase subunit F (NADH-binding)/NADH:ubiquinone oxidoreductase subunit E
MPFGPLCSGRTDPTPGYAMIVQALLEIQNRYGFLPLEELEFLALRARVPLYRVQEITTFFPHFRHTPPPRVSLHICQSMTCHLRGAPALLETARRISQRHGEQLEVRGVSCLGRCDRAPAALLSRQDPTANGHGHHELLFTELGTRHPLPRLLDDALSGKPLSPDTDRRTTERPNWQIDVYHPAHALGLKPYAAVERFLSGDLFDEDTLKRVLHKDKPADRNLVETMRDDPAVKQILDARLFDEANAADLLQRARDAELVEGLSVLAVIQRIKDAGLVGMGGAAARTYNKWLEVRLARGKTRYIICNADESEPGTFKDRELLLRTPHLVVEGMLLAGLTVGASRGYIYTRHEYPEQIAACRQAIEEARQIVPEAVRRCPLEVFTSPGLYICGEESALIEVIEGKRAQPRNQPPTIRENGLFDEPTVVNNVETYAWVPAILLRQPADWYQNEPLRFFSISGDVQQSGVFEVPFRCTLGELIEMAGGMDKGLVFHAAATSGPSGGFLPATIDAEKARQALDRAIPGLGDYDPYGRVAEFRKTVTGERLELLKLPLNVNAFRAMGLALGAAIVVYGSGPGRPISMLEQALNCLEFFEKESCGKCVPCRLGCQQLVHFASELQHRRVSLPQVADTVRTLAGVMKVTSICGLGRAASTPFATWLEHFQDEARQ